MSKARKKNVRREIASPFARIKHIHRMVERSRSANGLYAFMRCEHEGCKVVRTVLEDEDAGA